MVIGLIQSYTDKPWRSPETYALIEESLREKWQVDSIHTKDPVVLREFFDTLEKRSGQPVFAFNIAEYLDEENKAHFLPELLDEWEIPHLGSDGLANTVGLDKARTKANLIENQVPTPEYFVAEDVWMDLAGPAEKIGYPLIVKPIREGGHIGIGVDSIVYDEASLKTAVQRILEQFEQPALVEAFVTDEGMREFSVGVLDGEQQIFAPIEIDFEAMDVEVEILSFEAAQEDQERIKLVEGKEIRDEIIDLSKQAFEAVGANDYSRVDLRMNDTGCYVLEVNVMPGLGPNSFLPEAVEALYGLSYPEFIQNLTEESMLRQKKFNNISM